MVFVGLAGRGAGGVFEGRKRVGRISYNALARSHVESWVRRHRVSGSAIDELLVGLRNA